MNERHVTVCATWWPTKGDRYGKIETRFGTLYLRAEVGHLDEAELQGPWETVLNSIPEPKSAEWRKAGQGRDRG